MFRHKGMFYMQKRLGRRHSAFALTPRINETAAGVLETDPSGLTLLCAQVKGLNKLYS